MSAILEFYFRFPSRPFPHNRRVILYPAAEFRPNRNIRLKYDVISIFKMAAVRHVVFALGVMADHPRSTFRGLNFGLKSLVRRIDSSGDIAM